MTALLAVMAAMVAAQAVVFVIAFNRADRQFTFEGLRRQYIEHDATEAAPTDEDRCVKRILVNLTRCVAISGATILLAGAAAYGAGARINTTKSVAVGLYWIQHAPVIKGSYVMFCPPSTPVFDMAARRGYINPGRCYGKYGYMMKRVLAAKGDRVQIGRLGVSVNGRRLPFSAPYGADRMGRALPHYSDQPFVLTEDEVLLMTDVSKTSFDARYFGPVSRQQIQWVVRPVLTW